MTERSSLPRGSVTPGRRVRLSRRRASSCSSVTPSHSLHVIANCFTVTSPLQAPVPRTPGCYRTGSGALLAAVREEDRARCGARGGRATGAGAPFATKEDRSAVRSARRSRDWGWGPACATPKKPGARCGARGGRANGGWGPIPQLSRPQRGAGARGGRATRGGAPFRNYRKTAARCGARGGRANGGGGAPFATTEDRSAVRSARRSREWGGAPFATKRGSGMHRTTLALMLAVAVTAGGPMSAQNNWAASARTPARTKFSTLTQINADNVKNLKRAWTFHTGDTSGFFESGLHRHRRRHVLQRAERRLRARCRDRAADLEIRNHGHGAARTDVLARRQRRRPAHLFADGRRPGRDRSEDRHAHHELRREGIRRRPADDVAAGRLQERPGDAGRQLHRQGVGHRHRRSALDAQPQGAAGRSERRRRGSATV